MFPNYLVFDRSRFSFRLPSMISKTSGAFVPVRLTRSMEEPKAVKFTKTGFFLFWSRKRGRVKFADKFVYELKDINKMKLATEK